MGSSADPAPMSTPSPTSAAQAAALAQAQQQAAQQQAYMNYMQPSMAAPQANQGGGLMSQGVGQPLAYVPPAQGSTPSGGNLANGVGSIPAGAGGQGLMNGPANTNQLQASQMLAAALQAQSGQTAGGLMVGPNNTLLRAPASPSPPPAVSAQPTAAASPPVASPSADAGGGT